MSELKFPCPHCGRPLSSGAQFAGGVVKCPGCGRDVVIPQKETADSRPAESCTPLRRYADDDGGGAYLLVLLAPALLPFLMASGSGGVLDTGEGWGRMMLISVASSAPAALYCGFTAAKRKTSDRAKQRALGVSLSAMFFLFSIVASVVGCSVGAGYL